MRTFNWPKTMTSTWPSAVTFDWPLTHAPNGQTQPLSFGVRLLDEHFFWRGIRIVDLHLDHDSATLTASFGLASVAPAPIALPTQAGLAQNAPDRIRADEGQPIRGAAQGALERRQRPGGRPVALALWRSVEFAQDALLGGCVVQDGGPPSMRWRECRQTLTIEQTDQRRDRVARPPTSPMGSLDVRMAISHREQDLRARDERGWQAERSTDTLQVRPLLRTQRSERVFL